MCLNNFLSRVAALTLVATLVTACGGGGSAPVIVSEPGVPVLNIPPNPPVASNRLSIKVDAGPAGTGYNVNRLYASVTVCFPGSVTQCQTIDHVLVDTGSTGLRLLSSAMAPALKLTRLSGAAGLPLLNCAQFVDNTFAWGPVATADILLAGKTASSVPIQIIGDPAFDSLGSVCSSGSVLNTMATLGANGIIGMGLFKEDCGSRCETLAANGFYYTCTDLTCTAITTAKASTTQQLKNPVALFASDNNGVLIDLPTVSAAGATSVNGSLIFGIGTQSNNQWVSGGVLTTSSLGFIGTSLTLPTSQVLNLSSSFIDTGSNGLYFDARSIPTCRGSSAGFYCPDSLTSLAATLLGTNSVTVQTLFSIDNALAMFASGQSVLPALSGPIGDAHTFDWGLPFFYGRRVFIGIEEQPSPLGTGPFHAF